MSTRRRNKKRLNNEQPAQVIPEMDILRDMSAADLRGLAELFGIEHQNKAQTIYELERLAGGV